MAEELKPCPFCGQHAIMSEREKRDNYRDWMIECSDCDCRITGGDGNDSTWQMVRNTWNTRAESPEIRAIRKAVKRIEDDEKKHHHPIADSAFGLCLVMILQELNKEVVTL